MTTETVFIDEAEEARIDAELDQVRARLLHEAVNVEDIIAERLEALTARRNEQ